MEQRALLDERRGAGLHRPVHLHAVGTAARRRIALSRLIGFAPFSALAAHHVWLLMQPRLIHGCDLETGATASFLAGTVAILSILSGGARDHRRFAALCGATIAASAIGSWIVASSPSDPMPFCSIGHPPIRMAQDVERARSLGIATLVASMASFSLLSLRPLLLEASQGGWRYRRLTRSDP